MITTIAGDGTAAFGGDLGPATAAQINTPHGVAVDASGNVYFTDYGNNRIRKIDPSGTITTIAGTGVGGFSGDSGPATAARLYGPRGIAVDAAGVVYFSDYGNNRVRKISTTGIITTIAGNGFATFSGDGGPATAAALKYPWGVAIDATGTIYIADQMNCRVRKINTAGIISTVTGNGICFIAGDGGPATAAVVQYPLGVACGPSGELYIADYGNNRVRVINTTGVISTVAGSPVYGFSGDGGPSTASQFYYPQGIATDPAGNIYVCDVNNYRIRMINTSGIINTIAGTGVAGYSGDGGSPFLAQINRATGVAVDGSGKIYIADNENHRIRMIHIPTHAPSFVNGRTIDSISCPVESIDLDTMLAAFDVDAGQTETWSLISGPYHGTVAGAYATTSTGGVLYPSGFSYTPAAGYVGPDSFRIRVTDGALSDTTTVRIQLHGDPVVGAISGIDSLCPGDTYSFGDTTAGGSWSSLNPGVATVSATGVVAAVSAGVTIITYSVTNDCGISFDTIALRVSSACENAVADFHYKIEETIIAMPNPSDGNVMLMLGAPYAEPVHFTISDVTGRRITEFSSTSGKANNIHLSRNGIYFVTATTSRGTSSAKLVIE